MKTIRAPPNVPLEVRVKRLGASSPSVVLIVSVLDVFSNLGCTYKSELELCWRESVISKHYDYAPEITKIPVLSRAETILEVQMAIDVQTSEVPMFPYFLRPPLYSVRPKFVGVSANPLYHLWI